MHACEMLGMTVFWCVFACAQITQAIIVGRVKISWLEMTEPKSREITGYKAMSMDELQFCAGAKTAEPSGWILHRCERITKERNVFFSIDSNQAPTHVVVFLKSFDNEIMDSKIAAGSDTRPDVPFSERNSHAAMLPLMFPNEYIAHTVEVIDGIKFEVSLECVEKHFGPRCERYCDSTAADGRFKCHPQTGEIVCSFGWIGKDCAKNVFIDRKSASEFLKSRTKRSEERNDCSKRICNTDELRDEFLRQESEQTSQDRFDHLGGENLSACQSDCDLNGTLLCVREQGEEKRQNLCRCKPGYKGETCSELDLCYLEPCQNGGSCEDTIEGVACQCPDGFQGTFCEIPVDHCIDNPCGYDGDCESDSSGFRCDCHRGFTGENCETNPDDCTEESCSGRGTCRDGINSYDCVCDDGFYGKNCENATDGCLSVPCQNGGNCSSFDDGDFECDCLQGFEGETCENKTINPCDSSPCNGKGQCHVVLEEDDSEEYKYKEAALCVCDSDYAGKNCEIAVSSCEAVEFPCPHNATCINLESDYICACLPGYEGDNCERKCDPCEEMAELRCDEDPCENGARCLVLNNATTCLCPPGFTGERCQLVVDFCKNVSCAQGECISKKDTFLCLCEPGYDGLLCEEDRDECQEEHFLCKNDGQCRNTIGGYKCLCPKGFEGEHCDHEVDACSSRPCMNGGACYAEEGEVFTCQCNIGYVGFTCEVVVDFCADKPSSCLNGGKCEVVSLEEQEIKCTCTEKFYGHRCENEVPVCMVKRERADGSHEFTNRTDCGTYGKCTPDEKRGFKCECLEDYGGEFCDQKTVKIKECKEPYCACRGGLPNFKALPMASHQAAECRHNTYGIGKCVTDECLSQNCTDEPKSTCQYELECKEKRISPRRAHVDVTNNSCRRMWLYFEREKLPQDSSLQKMCDVLRNLNAVPAAQYSIIKCSLVEKTNSTVGIFASLEPSAGLNPQTIQDELYSFFANRKLNQTLDEKYDQQAFEILLAAKNVSDGIRDAVVRWHEETNSSDLPVESQHGREHETDIAIILAATFSAVISLVLLILFVVWLKKRRPSRSPTPAAPRPSENNNVPVSSVTWSKGSEGKLTCFENPLSFGVDNNAFANDGEGRLPLSPIQQAIQGQRNETETASRNGVSTFIPRGREVCSGLSGN